MKYITLTLQLLLSFFTYVIYAQSTTDSLKTDTNYKRLVKLPLLSVNYFNYGSSDFETNNQGGEISMDEKSFAFQFILPVKEKKWYLSNRIQYTHFTFNTSLTGNNNQSSEDFHSVAYSVGLIKILPKRWSLITNLSPTLATDFGQSLNSDDFVLQASVLAKKRSSPYFEYGFGLAYSTSLGNPLVIPLISLTYVKNNWETIAVLPAYISQNYLFNENTKLGARLAIYGNLYNTTFDNSTTNLDLNRVSYSRITIGPDFQTKIFGDIYLNIGTGITVRNILEFQDNDLNTELDLGTKNKFFFNFGLKLLK